MTLERIVAGFGDIRLTDRELGRRTADADAEGEDFKLGFVRHAGVARGVDVLEGLADRAIGIGPELGRDRHVDLMELTDQAHVGGALDDDVFGPGAGSFYMLAFVTLAGYGVLKATAHTKLLNFASNIGGFVVFAAVGVIDWKIGLMMGVAQFIGARVGASLAIRIGAKLIKPLLVVVCLALAAKLLADPDNPLRQLIGK